MFVICLLLWILFNGKFTIEILLFGLVISAFVYAMACALLGFSVEQDKKFVKKLPGILKLLWTLTVEIVKANIDVIKRVYSKEAPESCYTEFTAPLKSTGARVALADCITLTPGTITGELEDGKFVVHCLDKSLADGLDSSVFVKQLEKLEK